MLAAVLLAGCGGGQGATQPPAPGVVSATASTVSAAPAAIPAGTGSSTITVTARDAAGNPVSGATVGLAALGTGNTLTQPAGATNPGGVATGSLSSTVAETKTISATINGSPITQTANVTVFPGFSGFPIRGLVVYFERRGWATGYGSGEVLQRWDTVDAVVGSTVAAEVSLELDAIHGFGVNTIRYELRATDAVYINDGFTPPTCNIPPVLGVRWPQPTALELQKLVALFDLVQSKGMRVILELTNTHMEETPPTNSATWLGAILGAVKNHPALELVLFDGSPHTILASGGGTVCGPPAEAPLWLGPGSVPATYVQWAVGYGRSLGVPARKLSAEAVIGDYFTLSQPPAGPDATNGHLWDPIVVEKAIFDALQIPDAERTYGVSFYEHRKCATARGLPCADTDPDSWADQTLTGLFAVIGNGSHARVVAGEMGYLPPVSASWSTAQALQSLVTQMRRHGVDGGAFWRWTSFNTAEDSDPTLADPVKRRGVTFTYNQPIQGLLAQLYQTP